MISNAEKIELKKYLPHRYSKKIQEILLQRHIYTTGTETYSTTYITNVLNGEHENLPIETAIYELYDQYKATHELLATRKNSLLNKKPVDGHPQV